MKTINGTSLQISPDGVIMGTRGRRKLRPTAAGYLYCKTRVEGTSKHIKVHREVAIAFVPNPLGHPFVLHKDGNKLNNRSNNLYWGTPEDNFQDALWHGTATVGVNNGAAKFSKQQVQDIRLALGEGIKAQALAYKYKVSRKTINNISNSKTYTNLN